MCSSCAKPIDSNQIRVLALWVRLPTYRIGNLVTPRWICWRPGRRASLRGMVKFSVLGVTVPYEAMGRYTPCSHGESAARPRSYVLPVLVSVPIPPGDVIRQWPRRKEEVLAIAEHEKLPEIVATAVAYVLCQERASEKVRDMIIDNLRRAQLRGDGKHTQAVLHVLHHFLKTHPEARPTEHPWSRRF